MPRWGSLAQAAGALERWLLPGECLLCREPAGSSDPLICPTCQSRWASLPEPQCARCGQPLTPGTACRLCTGWEAGLSGVRSAVWLDDSARRAVHLLKYSGWKRVAEPLAGVIASRVGIAAGSALVPIPLGAARLRKRGYNQSAELAAALGIRLGLDLADVLARRRETTTQTALTPDARRANLAGAFEAGRRAPERCVLVDDVFTTGATLEEAARALLAAGAGQVSGVTFARAQRPLDAAATHDPDPSRWSRA